MKSNKSGFIAISLIYSFFLVLLMMLLAIMVDYTHNRVLLNKVKKSTQEKLNGLSEFNPIGINGKEDGTNYLAGDEIYYANKSWLVINDEGEYLIIMLKDAISGSDLSASVGDYNSGINVNKNTMYYGGDEFSYTWSNSLAKLVVNYWLENDALLQKAVARNTLVKMDFTDGIENYNEYIRVQTKEEFAGKDGSSCDSSRDIIWTLSVNPDLNRVFKTNNCLDLNHTVAEQVNNSQGEIHPVIKVKKI